jgi:proteasome lid subunit RPN8/RPN11
VILRIKRGVLDGILDAAARVYPNEFFCLLGGEKTADSVFVTELVYIPFRSGSTSAIYQLTDIPFDSRIVGSAHSHPHPSGPSSADLRAFPTTGLVHIIVYPPFSENSFSAYDAKGREIPVQIVD